MITTRRNRFIGFHVTKPMRDKLRRLAFEKGLSVSALVYRILLRHLRMKDES